MAMLGMPHATRYRLTMTTIIMMIYQLHFQLTQICLLRVLLTAFLMRSREEDKPLRYTKRLYVIDETSC